VNLFSAAPEPAGKLPEHRRSEPSAAVFFVFLTPANLLREKLAAGNSDHRTRHYGKPSSSNFAS
jgi:hypothetical protein